MRKNASNARTVVRLSVEIPVSDHAKIRAVASLRGVQAGPMVAGFIHAALRGVRIVDGGVEPDQVVQPDESAA